MHAAVALALLIAQPAPKKEVPKLDPFIAKAVEADANDTPLRKLQKERARERATALALIRRSMEVGTWTQADFTHFIRLQSTLAENLAELMDKPADKVKCYEMRLDAANEFERVTKARVDVGAEPPQNLNLAKAARVDAEIDLLKLKESIKHGK